MSAVRMYHAQCCCWFPQRRSIARRARAGRGERGRRETGGAAVRGREAGAPGGDPTSNLSSCLLSGSGFECNILHLHFTFTFYVNLL